MKSFVAFRSLSLPYLCPLCTESAHYDWPWIRFRCLDLIRPTPFSHVLHGIEDYQHLCLARFRWCRKWCSHSFHLLVLVRPWNVGFPAGNYFQGQLLSPAPGKIFQGVNFGLELGILWRSHSQFTFYIIQTTLVGFLKVCVWLGFWGLRRHSTLIQVISLPLSRCF